ncbi:MAG: DUF192 domain-containing protein [Armatimonadota bacterium]|nr:DUF192 domain-containing protein [Armatimonadota bacterium]MDR7486962.1 DUF192 domain-containing protein [Armatimonadota bacterium]MDR7532989.1 DUF192 domain-containing protein [Armatimonadota bacterium]
MYVINRTRGTYLGVDVQVANSFRARLLGLLAHRDLRFGDGVWLVPCNSVQTFGMRHPIDVVFLDVRRHVVRVVAGVRPARLILPVAGAHSALELPAGVVRSSETRIGDVIEFVAEPVARMEEDRMAGTARRGSP